MGLWAIGILAAWSDPAIESHMPQAGVPADTPADCVDLLAGTSNSRWMIAPGPWMPFSMVRISPDNQPHGWKCGYDYSRNHIDCFIHIHAWTMGGLGMMPTLGPLVTHPGLDGSGYSSRFDKSTERGGIGIYSVLLKDSGIQVDLTATTRASLQRYTFPASKEARADAAEVAQRQLQTDGWLSLRTPELDAAEALKAAILEKTASKDDSAPAAGKP